MRPNPAILVSSVQSAALELYSCVAPCRRHLVQLEHLSSKRVLAFGPVAFHFRHSTPFRRFLCLPRHLLCSSSISDPLIP